MKTHCTIQKDFCPRKLSICCLECPYSKSELCEADCMNHIAKCNLGVGVVEVKKENA